MAESCSLLVITELVHLAAHERVVFYILSANNE